MNRRCVGLVLAFLPAGCALSGLSPIPDARSPADRAHELDAKCGRAADPSEHAMLSPDAIDAVEPYMVTLPSSNGHDVRMLGATVHVRPLPGLTRESLARALQCHEARVVLGAPATAPDDPYVLAGEWLTIDVDSEGTGFVAEVYPADFKNQREVLERARRFASSRR